jgi:hypothetical protein
MSPSFAAGHARRLPSCSVDRAAQLAARRSGLAGSALSMRMGLGISLSSWNTSAIFCCRAATAGVIGWMP